MLTHLLLIFTFCFSLLFTLPSWAAQPLQINDPAPEFTSIDDLGQPVTLRQFAGKTVVLYFYPKDGTPGCTAEAQSFRDHFAEFEKKHVVILGISFDDAASHRKFKQNENLPFALLTTNQRQIAEAYGVGGMIFADRDTIIIGPDGKIKSILRSVSAQDHAKIILETLDPSNVSR